MRSQLLSFIVLLNCLTVSLSATAQVVDIPDPNLRTAIAAELGKSSGDTITVAEMERLTEFAARNAKISDLTGLEYATNLTALGLGDNNIVDISPLTGLTNLKNLTLSNNNIMDILPLSGLISMIGLYLDGNAITDISPIAGLTNLQGLDLWDNHISDISPLTGLIHLKDLILSNNNIVDSSPLVANTGLGSGDYIHVRGNPLSAVSLTHISALLSRGITVEFDNSVGIPDRNLRAAIEAELGKAVGEIITVEEMESLTELAARNANISDLTGLETATNLIELGLDGNSISNLSSLSKLTNLIGLSLGSNNISHISALAGLTSLTLLGINSNNISDISPLVANTELGSGDYVHVRGNPLSAVSLNTHIPTLLSRGVKVEFENQADINDDGIVNILDLVAVANEIGKEEQSLAVDVNGDGVVSILDLIAVAGHIQ